MDDSIVHLEVVRDQTGTALVEYLAAVLDISKREAKRIIDSREVFINRRRVWIATHKIKGGDRIELPAPKGKKRARSEAHATRMLGCPVLFHQDGVIVVNKPAGILAIGERGAEGIVSKSLRMKVIPVHRLDRDTTGCLIFAETAAVRDRLVKQFEDLSVKKRYLALVLGTVEKQKIRIDRPLDGKSAVSTVELKEAGELCSFVEVHMETGRTHQIRRHLMEIGHPVLGDQSYFKGGPQFAEFRAVPRQMLHASCVEFRNPSRHGGKISVTAPLPQDFKAVIKAMLRS